MKNAELTVKATATGVFTGCSSGDTEWFLENKISLKEQNGSLPEEGTGGDIQYKILEKGALSTHASESGYYIRTHRIRKR